MTIRFKGIWGALALVALGALWLAWPGRAIDVSQVTVAIRQALDRQVGAGIVEAAQRSGTGAPDAESAAVAAERWAALRASSIEAVDARWCWIGPTARRDRHLIARAKVVPTGGRAAAQPYRYFRLRRLTGGSYLVLSETAPWAWRFRL